MTMEKGSSNNHQQQSFEVSNIATADSKFFDDDGRLKRSGNKWTASAHIITAVIGSGVLSLAWAIAQLGWIAGPSMMLLFAFIIYYTSTLLSVGYRTGDQLNGKRNYTYTQAVRAYLGGYKVKLCGIIQYVNLFGVAIGYTIAASISMMAIKRSNCFHSSGGKNPCHMNGNLYMISFGIVQILFSQIPNFDQLWWLSSLAAAMSFTYSTIGLGLGVGKVIENKGFKGSLTGITVGTVTQTQKIWRSFQALGNIAFAYSYSLILIEIQDTIKSPPSESKTMNQATLISNIITTFFYMLCGCFGYAAFGDSSPGNLLTGFGFYNPFWLLDIANAAIVIHLVGAFQVFCQPIYSAVEKTAAKRFPDNDFINKEIEIPIPGIVSPLKINLFRLVWRSFFVIVTTIISMLLPFFNDVVGLIGAFAFWPLTVYFPVEIYIVQKRIPKWSTKWICLHILSVACLMISLAAGIGSVAGIVTDLGVYKPFHAMY
ncbi:amino acid permease 4 [Lathyrus oleraceus]|uniref:Amino acid permease 2 n=1 Tax=Pisum sativum TaxID=3888 RepID=A0A9D4W3M4_PEA|nr:amino acid permease 4-like [Pisum sativum]KAI5394368.1 Amino acid permease 2 [Pisum sativum]